MIFPREPCGDSLRTFKRLGASCYSGLPVSAREPVVGSGAKTSGQLATDSF
jgi:hypothetical protein